MKIFVAAVHAVQFVAKIEQLTQDVSHEEGILTYDS